MPTFRAKRDTCNMFFQCVDKCLKTLFVCSSHVFQMFFVQTFLQIASKHNLSHGVGGQIAGTLGGAQPVHNFLWCNNPAQAQSGAESL